MTLRLGATVVGCDAVPASASHWCAAVVGLIRNHRLVDPRLSLTCYGPGGNQVAFGWVEAVRGARWLVVGRGGEEERYPVLGGLPVRITSTEISLDSAVFDVAELAADGRELERRRIVMHAAG